MDQLEILNKQLPEIEFKGYEEIKQQLEEDVAKYQNYIVTEDTLDDDTKLRAELNKKAKAIDDKRKEIEKLVSAPIKEFKTKCDVLKNLYSDVSSKIDVQIKVFEEKRKESKRKEVNDLINKLSKEKGLNGKYVSQIEFDERYLNKTYEMKDIEKDLLTTIDNLLVKQNEEIANIEAIRKQVELVNQNIKVKLEAEDFIQKLSYMPFQEIILQITEKAKRIEQQEKTIQQEVEPTVNTVNIPKVEENESTFEFKLKITGTKSQLVTLRKFMEANNISYEKIGD